MGRWGFCKKSFFTRGLRHGFVYTFRFNESVFSNNCSCVRFRANLLDFTGRATILVSAVGYVGHVTTISSASACNGLVARRCLSFDESFGKRWMERNSGVRMICMLVWSTATGVRFWGVQEITAPWPTFETQQRVQVSITMELTNFSFYL